MGQLKPVEEMTEEMDLCVGGFAWWDERTVNEQVVALHKKQVTQDRDTIYAELMEMLEGENIERPHNPEYTKAVRNIKQRINQLFGK